MPIYRYWCAKCGESFEIEHQMKDDKLNVCPYCGEYETLKIVPQKLRVVNNANRAESDVLIRKEVEKDSRAGTGEVIKETVEETKKEMDELRESLSKEFDPLERK